MELVKLSKRLLTVANMVTKGSVVADIGTDHGYLPIYLVQNNISEHVIAMDVNKGPLNKAFYNIGQLHLENKIDIRLSDGLDNLKNNEANTVTICGMGGKLIAKILESGRSKISPNDELILSPQSEIQQFRKYLLQNDYSIVKEDMVLEDGKFYTIIKCTLKDECRKSDSNESKTDKSKNDVSKIDESETDEFKTNESEKVKSIKKESITKNSDTVQSNAYLKYGKYLLEHKNDILKEYLLKEQKSYLRIRENVDSCDSELAEGRINEIDYELSCIEEGLKYYEM